MATFNDDPQQRRAFLRDFIRLAVSCTLAGLSGCGSQTVPSKPVPAPAKRLPPKPKPKR
jgi:hypothetical protein